MRKKRKPLRIQQPEKVTVGDCLLAEQLGFVAVCNDGKFVKFEEDKQ